MLSLTLVFVKPVIVTFDNDELMLTGPDPWNIRILLIFIGSIAGKESNPSIPNII